jgi:hypothetical protein
MEPMLLLRYVLASIMIIAAIFNGKYFVKKIFPLGKNGNAGANLYQKIIISFSIVATYLLFAFLFIKANTVFIPATLSIINMLIIFSLNNRIEEIFK